MSSNNPNNIILCGFMASGKTSIAKALSKELGYPYIDTDALIIKESKMSISEIFDKYGEDYFRDLEFDTAHKLKNFNNTIISTGGGMLTFDRNVGVLKEAGTIIHIKREFDDIYQTLLKDKTRPLATQKTKEELKDLYKKRLDKYIFASDYMVYNKYISQCVKDIIKIHQRRC